MRIRALLAAVLFVVALFALASPAAAHHRSGHTGGPGAAVEDGDGDDDNGEDEDDDAYGHGGEDEEVNQGAGVAVSLGVIAGSVLLIGALGLKPTAETSAHG